MPETRSLESESIQAREQLARSFERLQKIIARVPERLKQYESAAKEADARTVELQELLDRERLITEQRVSLSESSREEVKMLQSRVSSLENDLVAAEAKANEKEATITELESSTLR